MESKKALIPLNVKYADKKLAKFVQAFEKICPLDLIFLRKLYVEINSFYKKEIRSEKKDAQLIKNLASNSNGEVMDKPTIPNDDPVKEILTCADNENVDLIITGIKTKSNNPDISTNKEELIYESDVPLIVLKNKIPSQIKHIVFPTKFSEESHHRAINMLNMLDLTNLCIHFIYVIEPKSYIAHATRDMEDLSHINVALDNHNWVEMRLKEFNTDKCPVKHKILEGDVKNEIAKYCNELDNSMVVLPFAQKKFLSMIFGNLIIELIKELEYPTLLLNDQFDTPVEKSSTKAETAKVRAAPLSL